jgi:hypothetical protein
MSDGGAEEWSKVVDGVFELMVRMVQSVDSLPSHDEGEAKAEEE